MTLPRMDALLLMAAPMVAWAQVSATRPPRPEGVELDPDSPVAGFDAVDVADTTRLHPA